MKQMLLFSTIVIIGLMFSNKSAAQNRVVDHNFNTWWSNINKYELNEHWFFSSELHVRRTSGLSNWQQYLIRPAINYRLNSSVNLTVGYTHVQTYPYGERPVSIQTPENNFWEEVTLSQKLKHFKFSHRYRMEHRYIGKVVKDDQGNSIVKGTNYAQRFRYRLTATVPISKDKKWFIAAFDETWVNLQNNLMPIRFDQNWAYLGIGYKATSKLRFEMGYLNQHIVKSDNVHYENNATIQTAVFYHFNKPEKNESVK